MTSTEIKVKECVEPIINNLGYNVYDVIYEKEGSDNYLRIFIDKDSGISINDCEIVNNAITDVLDERDFIRCQYFLEVSSSGLERLVRTDEHLKQNIGKELEIHTFKSVTDKKNEKLIKGILKDYDNKSITIEKIEDVKVNKAKKKTKSKENNLDEVNCDRVVIVIEKEDISKIKTIYNWED